VRLESHYLNKILIIHTLNYKKYFKGNIIKLTIVIFSLILTLHANTLEKVKLQLKWKHQFQSAGFIMAKEKGFYRDVGIDIEMIEYNNKTKIISDLLDDRIDFSVSDATAIFSRMNGVKIKSILVILQQSPYILVALKSSNIKTLKDFNNKNIALVNEANAVVLNALLKSNHIKYNRKKALFNFDRLLNKEVDLLTGYISNEPFIAKEKNIDIQIFNPSDYGFDGYGDILIASEELIKTNPKLVSKMYKATKKGWLYAFEHIEETADIIYDKYNTLHKSKKALIYEGETLKKLSGYGENFGELSIPKLKSIGQLYSFMMNSKHNMKSLEDFKYKPQASDINLTKEEQEYLNNIESIPTCYDTLFEPYTMLKDDKALGVTVDYLHRIEKKINKKFHFIYSDTAKKQYTMAYNKKCTVIPLVQTSPQTIPFIVPTVSAGKDNLVLVTKINEPYVFNMGKLKNKKIGIDHEAYALIKYLHKKYPNIDYIETVDDKICLSRVENGELLGCIGTSIMMNYKLSNRYKYTLKVMKVYKDSYVSGSIGVHSDEPILLSILNKAVASLEPVTQDEIFDKWINTKYEKIIDYTLIWQIIFVSCLLLGLTLYWNRRLNKEVAKKKYAQKKLNNLNNNLENEIKKVTKEILHKETLLQNQYHLAQMGEMIAMIAHQWRQPLSAINSAIVNIEVKQNLNFKNLDNKESMDKFLQYNTKKLNQIESYVHFLSKTIDDFREFFNKDKNKNICSINKTIEKSLNIINSALVDKGIKIHKKLDSDTEINIYETEIIQVILNILINAKDNFEHLDIQDPKIVITTFKTDKKLNINISDNGEGIADNTIEKIFDPYFSTKNAINGTGLGLYMSKTIIEEHHKGVLSANNILNGVEFIIVLPLQ